MSHHRKLIDTLERLATEPSDTTTRVYAETCHQAAKALSGGNNVDRFLVEVSAEIERARAKFPGDNLTTIAMFEEAGEVAKAVLSESPEAIRKECVQLACMAARITLDGDTSTTGYRAAQHGLAPIVKTTKADAFAARFAPSLGSDQAIAQANEDQLVGLVLKLSGGSLLPSQIRAQIANARARVGS